MNGKLKWDFLKEREKVYENWEKYCQQLIEQGDLKEIPLESFKDAFIEREKAIDELSNVTNDMELQQWAKEIFLPAHKNYLRVCGLRPCEAKDCARIFEPPKRKYCSEECKQREKSRRWRRKNPDKKEKANLKYLKDIHSD